MKRLAVPIANYTRTSCLHMWEGLGITRHTNGEAIDALTHEWLLCNSKWIEWSESYPLREIHIGGLVGIEYVQDLMADELTQWEKEVANLKVQRVVCIEWRCECCGGKPDFEMCKFALHEALPQVSYCEADDKSSEYKGATQEE